MADKDHGNWYREMFAPGVTAGLLRTSDLAGYRNGQVYIRRSRHVPLGREAVRGLMPVFFDLLRNEPEPAVRAIRALCLCVYLSVLMNTMPAAGGWNWTVITVEKHNAYMVALESASVQQNIVPFMKFLAGLIQVKEKI